MSAGGLHLLVNVAGAGYHRAGWREPGVSPTAFVEFEHFRRAAAIAERGLLDAILLADIPAQSPTAGSGPTQALEPTLLCASLALTTKHLGFLPTVSTSFNHPYNLARRLLSLDHASGGRAGWNAVTTAMAGAARNFGQEEVLPGEDRYRRAAEFVALTQRLWDSWAEDALIGDQDSGEFADPSRIHQVDHRGEWFQVQGPMNVPRSPQGRPVICQAGASDAGMRFAAQYAEVVYGSQLSLPGAIDFADAIRRGAAAVGRDPAAIRFLPALVVVVGETEEEAEARWQELEGRLANLGSDVERLEAALWLAPGTLTGELDAPLDPGIFHHQHEGFARAISRFVADARCSARELARSVVGGHRLVIGSTEQVADHIEQWWRAGAVDGFTLAPPAVPRDLERFVELVVPELQRRGIYRTEYPGATLRANLGLPVPASSFTTAAATAG